MTTALLRYVLRVLHFILSPTFHSLISLRSGDPRLAMIQTSERELTSRPGRSVGRTTTGRTIIRSIGRSILS